MKICKKCGAQGSDTAKFCRKCGSKLDEIKKEKVFCENCGCECEEDDAFCPECGHRLSGEAPVKPKNEEPANVTVKKGDIITFGRYPQSSDGTPAPIEWRVLDEDDGDVLLISKYALDSRQYDTESDDVTWESCSLREWLNGSFLNRAFNAEERGRIKTTRVTADDNPEYYTDPGDDTTDKIFLLSSSEAEEYFHAGEMKCIPTEYAKAQGAYTNSNYRLGNRTTCWWWLRTPGFYPGCVAYVSGDGSIYNHGFYADQDTDTVRPALWINRIDGLPIKKMLSEEPLKVTPSKENAEEAFNKGEQYYYGDGVPQDYRKAVEWYTKAAEQGHAGAQYSLGECYYFGDGVPQDYRKAVEWYAKAARQEHADAQYSLGECYCAGDGVPQDYQKAAEWYTKAAKQGQADAQYCLGGCYEKGRGVPQDDQKAVEWYTKAAEQENMNAQFNLGVCYANGRGVEKSGKTAVKWYIKAAEQGHVTAQYYLGNRYKDGRSLPQSYEKAAKWYAKAAEKGHKKAAECLKELKENGLV